MKLSTLNLLTIIGFSLIYLGLILNWNVMIKNEGTMPVKTNLRMDTSQAQDHYSFYSGESEVEWEFAADRYYLAIGDYFMLYSLGDVLIVAGFLLFVPTQLKLIWNLKKWDL